MDGKKSATKHYLDNEQQKWFEEENGLRETSSHTAEYVMPEKPTGFWVTMKMSQRKKKTAQRPLVQDDSGGEIAGAEDSENASSEGTELGNRFGALAS